MANLKVRHLEEFAASGRAKRILLEEEVRRTLTASVTAAHATGPHRAGAVRVGPNA